MPYYIFFNPNNLSEKIELFFHMNDNKEYIKNGIKWKREYIISQVSIDQKWDSLNSKDFVNKSRNKKGTVNDLFEKSAELSEKRTKLMGRDEKKKSWYDNWQQRRRGKCHPDVLKQKGKEDLAKKGVILED